MIEPHDTVFLGSGTTVAHLLRYVDPELEARVVTPSLGAAAETQGLRLEIVFLGGLYRPHLNAVEGTWPLEMIVQFNADKTFLGADGLDSKAGLTTPSIAVAGIELAMIRRTRGEVVVLADNNKIGLVCPVVISLSIRSTWCWSTRGWRGRSATRSSAPDRAVRRSEGELP